MRSDAAISIGAHHRRRVDARGDFRSIDTPSGNGFEREIYLDAALMRHLDDLVGEESSAPSGALGGSTGPPCEGLEGESGAMCQPCGIAEIVDPQMALVAPADRVRVHAEIVALRGEPGHPIGIRGKHVVGPSIHLRDLWIRTKVPAENRGRAG